MITLIKSRIKDTSPDLSLLQGFEQFCESNSNWSVRSGAVLFAPLKLSARVYTALHTILKPALKRYVYKGAVISLGLPYRNRLFSKTFPYYAFGCDLRVLWTYDVWEPDYKSVERMVREAQINLLLLSSYQATEHFSRLNIPNCEVHWVSESINPADYKFKPWIQRSTDVLSFGRTWESYHQLIHDPCVKAGINYRFQELGAGLDTAVHGLKKKLQFPDWASFIEGLSDAKICICFPRAMTHPDLAGNVSTLTLRYLQAMASKCLILGSSPFELQRILDYSPVIEVDWGDPANQIKRILEHPEQYQDLIERNYQAVHHIFHHNKSIEKIESLVRKRLN